ACARPRPPPGAAARRGPSRRWACPLPWPAPRRADRRAAAGCPRGGGEFGRGFASLFLIPPAARCFLIARPHDVPPPPLSPPSSLGRGPPVEFRIHPARAPFAFERRLEFPANGGILLVIRDGAAAFAQVDGAIVHELLAGTAGLARALVVGPVPGGDAQALLA